MRKFQHYAAFYGSQFIFVILVVNTCFHTGISRMNTSSVSVQNLAGGTTHVKNTYNSYYVNRTALRKARIETHRNWYELGQTS